MLYDADHWRGDFIIEKRGGQPSPPDAYAGSHSRRPQTILYRSGHHHGYVDTLLALRDDRVAVVHDEELDDITLDQSPIATDWDARVRANQTRYRFIEPGNGADYRGSLTLRSLDERQASGDQRSERAWRRPSRPAVCAGHRHAATAVRGLHAMRRQEGTPCKEPFATSSSCVRSSLDVRAYPNRKPLAIN